MNSKTTILAGAALLASAWTASAGITAIADPGGTTTEIGARIRWANSGFEASIWDNSPFAQTPTLNPSGSPVWGVGNAYKFQVTFDPATGTLGLDVDFDRNLSFGAGESITRSVFNNPPQTSYTGYAFKYLSISGNEEGSTARSTVANLVINGTSVSSLSPNGVFLQQFYKDSAGLIGPLTITGDLTFTTQGTSQERPSWNFNLKDSAVIPPAVPEPSTYLAGALLLLPFGASAVRALRKPRAA